MDKHELIRVAKARNLGNGAPPDTFISLRDEPDRWPWPKRLDEGEAWYEEQARQIEYALYHSLPGGTYDRLLASMMRRAAGYMQVSHASLAQPVIEEQAATQGEEEAPF